MKAALLAGALLGAAGAASPCGVCVEDKVAATYDYGVIARAIKDRRVVVFCELAGRYDGKHVMATAARQRGVDPRSVRLSPNPAALSFAIDPKLQSPQAAVAAIRKTLSSGSHVAIVKIL